MSLKRKAISSVAWTSAQQFGLQTVGFIVSIVLARLLLPADFGIIGIITIFIAVGNNMVDSGLSQSLIRTEDPDETDYSTVFFFNLGGSIAIYLLIFFASPLIARFYDQQILTNIIRVYCLSFIITAFSAVQLTRLTKKMDFRTQLFISLPSLIISGVLGIYMAYKGFGVWSLVWMYLAQSFLNAVQLWLRIRWRPKLCFSKKKFREHFLFGYKLTLSGLIDTTFNNIYPLIIGKFFSTSQVGFYTRADSLKQMPVSNLSSILNKVTYPLFASIQNDDLRLKRAYKEIMQMVIFVLAPTLLFMAVMAEPLFRFLFTEKWIPAVQYFQILCLAGILYPIHSYNLNVLKVKGRSDLFFKLEIIKKGILILVLIFTLRYGIIILIWGQVFTSVIAFFVNTYYTGRFLNYTAIEQLWDILPIIMLSFFCALISYGIDFYIGQFLGLDIYRLVIGFISISVIYIGFSALFKLSAFLSLKKILRKHDTSY